MQTLRSLRRARDLTQIQVAKALGIGQGAVQKWENGVNSIPSKRLPRLAALLGVSVAELAEALPDTSEPPAGAP